MGAKEDRERKRWRDLDRQGQINRQTDKNNLYLCVTNAEVNNASKNVQFDTAIKITYGLNC